jgi:hypothetical protein
MRPTRLLYTNLNQKTQFFNYLYDRGVAYRRGIMGGLGACTAIGTTGYIFWPSIQSKSTNTASNILLDEKVKRSARLFVEDEDTRNAVISMFKSLLDDENTKEITRKFVIDVLNDEWTQEQLLQIINKLTKDKKTKIMLTELLLMSSLDALKDKKLHDHTADALKSSVWNIFF